MVELLFLCGVFVFAWLVFGIGTHKLFESSNVYHGSAFMDIVFWPAALFVVCFDGSKG
jgi:hypothetical protein